MAEIEYDVPSDDDFDFEEKVVVANDTEQYPSFLERPISDMKVKSNGIKETDNRIEPEDVPGFRGKLMEHQKAVIYAMYHLVQIGERKLRNGGVIKTNAGILSEELNSGKTIEVISLILMLKAHKQNLRPIIMQNGPQRAYSSPEDVFVKRVRKQKEPLKSPIVIHYYPKHVIRPALIITSSSTLIKWQDEFSRFTDLKVFIVETKPSIEVFADLMTPRERYDPKTGTMVTSLPINDYDVIIIRNGNVTRNLKIIHDKKLPEEESTVGTINIVDLVYHITSYVIRAPWSIIFIDDFDQISLPAHTRAIPAFFTWYISATFRRVATHSESNLNKEDPDNILRSLNHCNYRMTVLDPFLRLHFNIFCLGDFTQKSINPPKVFFYMNVFKNPADEVIGLIGRMELDEANEVIEALNGDAFEDAANILGIKSDNPADMFERLFDDSYEKMVKTDKYMRLITMHIHHAETLAPNRMDPAVITEITTAIQDGEDVTADITCKCSVLIERLKNLLDTATKRYNTHKNRIDRIRSNIREAICPACNLQIAANKDCADPNEIEDAIIMKCCMIILCSECALKSAHITKTSAHCAGCKRKINPKQDMVFINKNFNLARLADMSLEDIDATKEKFVVEEIKDDGLSMGGSASHGAFVNIDELGIPKEDPATMTNVMKYTDNLKVQCLVELILGKDNPKRIDIGTNKITKMFHGTRVIPETEPRGLNDGRIYMVFATYNKTLRDIEKSLKKANISFVNLGGTASHMADTLHNLKNYKVLLVNSTRHCSGIHLAALTDIVEMNRPIDPSIGRQIRSRFDLIGGQHNCRVHLMYYENEHRAYQRDEM